METLTTIYPVKGSKMIIPILLTLADSESMILNHIADLPAPATVFYAVLNGNHEMHKNMLATSKTIIDWYANLDEASKGSQLRAWYLSVRQLNSQLRKTSVQNSFSLDSDKRNEIQKGDFSKIDILLLIDNKPTFFFRPDQLKQWYNVSKDAGFQIQIPSLQTYRGLVLKAEYRSFNDGSYSFESKMRKSEDQFIQWIKGIK